MVNYKLTSITVDNKPTANILRLKVDRIESGESSHAAMNFTTLSSEVRCLKCLSSAALCYNLLCNLTLRNSVITVAANLTFLNVGFFFTVAKCGTYVFLTVLI